jgi:hypothetical protein
VQCRENQASIIDTAATRKQTTCSVFQQPGTTTVLQNPTGLRPLSIKGLFSRRFRFVEWDSPLLRVDKFAVKPKGSAFVTL